MSDPLRVTAREAVEIAAANDSGRRPIVFVHGLWALANSWSDWAAHFTAHGYAPITVDWPGDQPDRTASLADANSLAGLGIEQIVDHTVAVVAALDLKPVVVGHSMGGLVVQILAGRGLNAATVALSPAPMAGVWKIPPSMVRSVFPVLRNPANFFRAVPLGLNRSQRVFTNAVSEDEGRAIHEKYVGMAPARPLFQTAVANIARRSPARVDTTNPDRGPMLLVAGSKDRICPRSVVKAAFGRQRLNPGTTQYLEVPDAGHSLFVDHNWKVVADAVLAFASANSSIESSPDQ